MLARELLVAGRKEIEKYLNSLGVGVDIKLEGIQSGWKNKRIINLDLRYRHGSGWAIERYNVVDESN